MSATTELEKISTLTYESLAEEAQSLREKFNKLRLSLSHYFVARQDVIDMMVICALAQEPLLLVGPPGTAKSDLVLKFRDAIEVDSENYFEYMLTRFTEPSEILGPIDIQRLRDGAYVRRVQGKLPTASLVFLDEIFKSNSAILNTLLTIINEKKYYQDGMPLPVNLKVLIAATNEIPEQEELAAIKDRFAMKVLCQPVQETHFFDLLDLGLASQTQRDLKQTPWIEGHANLIDFLKAHRYLSLQMAKVESGGKGNLIRDRHRYIEESLLRELQLLLKTLSREEGIFVSDRKVIKLYKLLRTKAWLLHGGKIEKEDLTLLTYLGDNVETLYILEEKIPKLLGLQ